MVKKKKRTCFTLSGKNYAINCAIQGVRLIWKQKIWLAICKFLWSLTNQNAWFVSSFCTEITIFCTVFEKTALLLTNQNGEIFFMYIIRQWKTVFLQALHVHFSFFWHFVDVLVLSTTWNDLFCRCVDDVSIWWQMFNFVFLCPKRWFQFNSRIVRTHFSSTMSLNNWKMIAERRSYIFRWRSPFRRRRVCLSSLISKQNEIKYSPVTVSIRTSSQFDLASRSKRLTYRMTERGKSKGFECWFLLFGIPCH